MDSDRQFQLKKDRLIDELIGVCKGTMFDGSISKSEVENLYIWFDARPYIANEWVARKLSAKVRYIVDTDTFTQDDEKELIDLIMDIVGGREFNDSGINEPTNLPLCPNPPAEIVIQDSHFSLTGNFESCSRKEAELLIISHGGFIKKNANSKCHYLVIGNVGSNDYAHSSFGRKIEEGVKTREKGHAISIVSEEHFFRAIQSSL